MMYRLHSRQPVLSLILIFSFLFLNFSSNAQAVYWDGGAGTNNWMDADNWSTNQLPVSASEVSIHANNVEINGTHNITIKNLSMSGGSILTIGSNITINADYISLQQTNTEIINNGTITIDGGYDFGISLGGFTSLTNNGQINVYNSAGTGSLKLWAATVTNHGTIYLDGSTNNGDGINIDNFNSNISVFYNYGNVTITNTMGDGISGGGIYHNYGTTNITNVTYFNDLLLDGEDGLNFENYTGATFLGDGNIDPTTFNWNGGKMTSDYGNNTPGIAVFFCLGNCSGENFNNANLIFNIDGTVGPGVQNGYDQIQINQNAELGGNFELILGPGFTPEVGDNFVIMTYASKTGNDPTFILPSLPGDRQWIINIGAQQIEASVSSLLPVEMISFEAKNKGDHINLNWTTASEINNRGFFIEKSDDGMNWELLDFVEGTGDEHSISHYQYEDPDPYLGKNYYRLVQSDFDGTQTNSKVVSVNFNTKNLSDEINIYPNPITRGNHLNISFFEDDIEFEKLSVYNYSGQLIFHQYGFSKDMKLGTYDFTRGAYWLLLENRNEKVSKQFIVVE